MKWNETKTQQPKSKGTYLVIVGEDFKLLNLKSKAQGLPSDVSHYVRVSLPRKRKNTLESTPESTPTAHQDGSGKEIPF